MRPPGIRVKIGAGRDDWWDNGWEMSIDWDKIRDSALVSEAPPVSWPPGVRTISQDGLSLLGIGHDGALYLDGQRLALSRELKLQRTEKIIAGIAAVGVLFSGLGALFAALPILRQFLYRVW
jgi:hypothetical protein